MSNTSTNPLDCYHCINSNGCTKKKERLATLKDFIMYSDKERSSQECSFYIHQARVGESLAAHYYTGDITYD